MHTPSGKSNRTMYHSEKELKCKGMVNSTGLQGTATPEGDCDLRVEPVYGTR